MSQKSATPGQAMVDLKERRSMSRLDVALMHRRDGSVNKGISVKELNSTGKKKQVR